jgi:hypothetical protein
MAALARSNTRGRERTAEAGGARGEAIGDGAVGARDARHAARERGSHTATARRQAGPARETAADRWAPHINDF